MTLESPEKLWIRTLRSSSEKRWISLYLTKRADIYQTDSVVESNKSIILLSELND